MSEPERPARRKARRFLGCLVKGPLGCLAFLVGAVLVLVVLAPSTLGDLLTTHVAEEFNEAHAGTLEFGRSWFGSLYGDQEVKGIVLRDPDGAEVLNGTWSAPSLLSLFTSEPDWQPGALQISGVNLERDATGVTNLERVFARRPPGDEAPRSSLGKARWSFSDLELELKIDRLTWKDADGRSFRLERVVGSSTWFDEGDTVRVEGSGSGHVSGTDGGRIEFTWSARDLIAPDDRPPSWTFALSGARTPSAVLHALFESLPRLEPALAEEVDACELRLEGTGGSRTLERLVVEGLEIDLPGGD